MHKTTLYLPDQLIENLRALSLQSPRKSLTYHIQEAVREYLKNRKVKKRFATLLKYKGVSKGRSAFGDSVEYQRKLRAEWER